MYVYEVVCIMYIHINISINLMNDLIYSIYMQHILHIFRNGHF
jgi:hypothetical protein